MMDLISMNNPEHARKRLSDRIKHAKENPSLKSITDEELREHARKAQQAYRTIKHIKYLIENLGGPMTCYLVKETKTSTLSKWISEEETPTEDQSSRLKLAYHFHRRIASGHPETNKGGMAQVIFWNYCLKTLYWPTISEVCRDNLSAGVFIREDKIENIRKVLDIAATNWEKYGWRWQGFDQGGG